MSVSLRFSLFLSFLLFVCFCTRGVVDYFKKENNLCFFNSKLSCLMKQLKPIGLVFPFFFLGTECGVIDETGKYTLRSNHSLSHQKKIFPSLLLIFYILFQKNNFFEFVYLSKHFTRSHSSVSVTLFSKCQHCL